MSCRAVQMIEKTSRTRKYHSLDLEPRLQACGFVKMLRRFMPPTPNVCKRSGRRSQMLILRKYSVGSSVRASSFPAFSSA